MFSPQDIKMVTQKTTEETKTNIMTRKTDIKIHKHETHNIKTETPSDENIEDNKVLKDVKLPKAIGISKVAAPLEPSDEEEAPKNKNIEKIKEISRFSKDTSNRPDVVSTSEYETESFPLESQTDDDVEKSILDFDSDLEPKIVSPVQQRESLEKKTSRKIKISSKERQVSPSLDKESKVCKCPI